MIDPQVGPVTGQVGTELTFFITVTGCASSNKLPSFKVVDGRPPPGTKLFDFAGSTGLINGVPTTAGSFTFTVRVKDETRATDTETFTIEILPPEAPTITTEALSGGTVGEFYCCGNLFASGGVQPYTWSVVAGALPPGLELPKGENTISGTPTTAGTFTFTVRVTDDLGAFSEQEFSITISERQPAASAIPSMRPAIATSAVIGSFAMPRGTPGWLSRGVAGLRFGVEFPATLGCRHGY